MGTAAGAEKARQARAIKRHQTDAKPSETTSEPKIRELAVIDGGKSALEVPGAKNPAYRVWRNVPQEERSHRLQAVIGRVVNDEKLADIAKDIGLSRSALNMALLEYAEDDWKKAQVARAITRLERARDIRGEMLDGKRETEIGSLTLARDEEKSAQWELEKLMRRLFGQDQAQQVSQVTIQIADLRGLGATNAVVRTVEPEAE